MLACTAGWKCIYLGQLNKAVAVTPGFDVPPEVAASTHPTLVRMGNLLDTCKEGKQVFRMSDGKSSDGKQQKGQASDSTRQTRASKKASEGKQLAADASTAAPSLQKVLSADIGQYTGGLVMEDGDLVVMVWESETWQCPRVCGAAWKTSVLFLYESAMAVPQCSRLQGASGLLGAAVWESWELVFISSSTYSNAAVTDKREIWVWGWKYRCAHEKRKDFKGRTTRRVNRLTFSHTDICLSASLFPPKQESCC